MGLKRTDEFRQDAVRIALTSGLTQKQVADDLGVGMSTLNKWITAHRDTDMISKEDLSLAQENDRLRRENRILKEEKEVLKKAKLFFASQSNPVTNGLPFMLSYQSKDTNGQIVNLRIISSHKLNPCLI